MKIKQTILSLALLMGISIFFTSPNLYAADCGGQPMSIINCDQTGDGSGVCPDGSTVSKTAILSGTVCPDGSSPDTASNSGIWGLLLMAINILTAGIGVAGVGGIAYGAVMYTTAGGSAEQVTKAKTIIKNTIIGLGAYALMYSLLNYLIPGGLFKI